MAHAWRRGTLGNLAGHQRGEAADPMEPRPARAAAMPASLEQNVAAGTVRSVRETSFGVPAARVRQSAVVYHGDAAGDFQAGHGAPLPSRPNRRAATPAPA